VQVAVAQVAEIHQAHAGHLALQQRIGFGAEGRNLRHRDADVVLDVQALFGLRQRNALADVPQRVACDRFSATTASATTPLSKAVSSKRSNCPRAWSSDSLSLFSSSTQYG
jgi:hypothetical protein